MFFPMTALQRAPVPVWTVKTAPVATVAQWLPQMREFIALPAGDTSRDAELTAFANAAVAAIEAYARLTVFRTTFTARLSGFSNQIALNKRPFVDMTGLTCVADATGEIITPSTALYHVLETAQQCGTVFLGDGLAWPDTARRADAVRIDVLAGFDAAAIPAEIVHAVLLTVAHLDHDRGECGGGGGQQSVYAMKNAGGSVLPDAARALLAPWRYIYVGAI